MDTNNEVQKSNKNEPFPIPDPLIDKILFNKYKLLKKIGKGSFGNIYLSKEKDTNEYYAIKIENKNTLINFLVNEANMLLYLNCPKTPSIKSFGYTNNYNYLIMELLGKSLEDIFENILQKKPMSLRCVCNLGYQMIDILEFIHNKNVIHRDIKPDNFLMSNGDNKYLYLLDFGLAKKFRENDNSKHFPFIKGKKLTGTARYASVNALNGDTQSRRDDLESVGYVLLYFLKGKLPWQSLMIKNKEERYHKIMEIKRDISTCELCQGCPEEFQKYFDYVRKLEYEEDPDYNMIKSLFINILEKNEFKFDYYYDWDIKLTINDCNNFNNNKQITDKNNEDKYMNNFDMNRKKEIDDENSFDLPLDKIYYRKKNRKKKRNKSQDKSTADGAGEEVENDNNSIEENLIQNHNDCCIII